MADDRLDDAIDAVVRAVDRIERATRGAGEAAPALPDAAAPVHDAPASPAAPADDAHVPHDAPAHDAPAPPAALKPQHRGAPDMSANTGSFWLPRPEGIETRAFAPGLNPVASHHQGSSAPAAQPASQSFTTHELHAPSGVEQPEQPYDVTHSTPPSGPYAPDQPQENESSTQADSPTLPLPPPSTGPYAPDPRPQNQAATQADSPRLPLPPPSTQPRQGFDAGAGLGSRSRPVSPQTTTEFSALGAAAVRPFAEHGASPEIHELVGRIVGRMQSLDDHLDAAGSLRGEINELVARLAAAAVKPR